MLEAQPFDCVGKLDVDAEVVGVELQVVAAEQARLLVDVHGERRDLAIRRELPVAVARGFGAEIDGAIGRRFGHAPPPIEFYLFQCLDRNYSSYMFPRQVRRAQEFTPRFSPAPENPVRKGGNGGKGILRLLAVRRVADPGITSVSTGQ